METKFNLGVKACIEVIDEMITSLEKKKTGQSTDGPRLGTLKVLKQKMKNLKEKKK